MKEKFTKEFEKKIGRLADKINGMDADQIQEYLDGALDVELRTNVRKEYRSVKAWVALRGPNICIDTDSGTVEGYWAGYKAARAISAEAVGLIDEYYVDKFCCL